jgi:hypothetical protein
MMSLSSKIHTLNRHFTPKLHYITSNITIFINCYSLPEHREQLIFFFFTFTSYVVTRWKAGIRFPAGTGGILFFAIVPDRSRGLPDLMTSEYRRHFPQEWIWRNVKSCLTTTTLRLYSVWLMHSDYFYIVHDHFLLCLQEFCQCRLQESISPILHALMIRPSINFLQNMPTSYPYSPTRLIRILSDDRLRLPGSPGDVFPFIEQPATCFWNNNVDAISHLVSAREPSTERHCPSRVNRFWRLTGSNFLRAPSKREESGTSSEVGQSTFRTYLYKSTCHPVSLYIHIVVLWAITPCGSPVYYGHLL